MLWLREHKARKEIIWLNVITGKFCKQFLSEEGSLFLTVYVFVVVEVKNNRFFLKKALIINAIIVVNYMH